MARNGERACAEAEYPDQLLQTEDQHNKTGTGVDQLPYQSPGLDNWQRTVFSYAGLLCLIVALAAAVVFIIMLTGVTFTNLPYTPEQLNSLGKDLQDDLIHMEYGARIMIPLSIVVIAVFLAGVGCFLLRTAGATTKEVIPRQDYVLLSGLLKQGNEKALDQYVRLSSLAGFMGLFTKTGLYGLPLATIVLTLVFAVLGTQSEAFARLAELTLGAFLGSYVQRTVAGTPRHPK